MSTLHDYYAGKGQPLPSLAERAKSYEALGLGSASSYRGTAEQNRALLGGLKSGGKPSQESQKARCHLPASPSNILQRLKKIIAFFPKKEIDSPSQPCTLQSKSPPISTTQETGSKNGDLEVTKGQVTFDSEGNDDSTSPYFSRHIHWPGNDLSGVTLGRGYDMGNRTSEEIEKDLRAAGVSPERAKAYAAGAGLKGADAKNFVAKNQTNLGLISHDEQKRLFNGIYPTYEKRAKDSYNFHKPINGKEWEELDPAIRDIVVDFNYQGFGRTEQGYGRPMQKAANNDPAELAEYIRGNKTMQIYEAGRGRVKYLQMVYGENI